MIEELDDYAKEVEKHGFCPICHYGWPICEKTGERHNDFKLPLTRRLAQGIIDGFNSQLVEHELSPEQIEVWNMIAGHLGIDKW